MDSPSSDGLEYYFVSYSFGQGIGNIVVSQNKPPEGMAHNGFNFSAATEFLHRELGHSAVIITWHKTTRINLDRWNSFVTRLEVPSKRHLTLVKT